MKDWKFFRQTGIINHTVFLGLAKVHISLMIKESMLPMKQRIWELDALRGIGILIMTAVHLCYDLAEFWGFPNLTGLPLFSLMLEYGGILFVLLSGLCATLGHRTFRRGVAVFAWGMLCTAVTWSMARLGLLDHSLVIRFGILHCLGSCMMLWPMFRRFPPGILAGIGVLSLFTGAVFQRITVFRTYLFPLGLTAEQFSSGDYFPLLPHLGWFLLGSILGRRLYPRKQSRFPGTDPDKPLLRFLRFCGTHSLVIYLIHQPLIFLIHSILMLL